MRQWPRRMGETLLEDRTRQVQILGSLAAFGVAYWLWNFQTPTDPKTARAVFYFLSERTFALILWISGLLQLVAVGGPWWNLRYVAAAIKLTVWLYATVCYWLTNPDPLAVPLLMVMVLAELFIAIRALHDKDKDEDEIDGSVYG
jgi:uncharacterized membrane protein